MNVHKFLNDHNNSNWIADLIVEDPSLASSYLETSFIFDLVVFIGSIIGIFVISILKPESILYYIFVCTLFVYYLNNVFSIRTYISLFVENFLFKIKLLQFYQQGSEEERQVIERLINTLPKDINDIYRVMIDELSED